MDLVTARKVPVTERCPVCQGPLPEPRTCPECGKVFYRGPDGNTTAVYCSRAHQLAAGQRRWRQEHPVAGRMAARRETLHVACETCGQPAGKPCRTPSGTVAKWPHIARTEKARREKAGR
jgi:hypothetical protein